MLHQHDEQDFGCVKQVNAVLTRSLRVRRCYLLIEECRAQITPANSSEKPFMPVGKCAEDDEQRD